MHNGDAYGAPRALLILEAQAVLVRFLRDFAVSMIANIDALTVEQTLQRLDLSGRSIIKRLELKEFSWTQFAMTYYNVSTSSASRFSSVPPGKIATIISATEPQFDVVTIN